MEDILKLLDKLLLITEDEENVNLKKQFYKQFCGYKFIRKNEEKYLFEYILPTLDKLNNKRIIEKDLVYLTLIAYNNLDILNKFIKYEKSTFKLDVRSPESLYDYCIFKDQHWFYGILKSSDSSNVITNKDMCNKILCLRLIHATNLPEIDIEEVYILLRQIQPETLEPFWKYYVNEINYLMDMFYYCSNFNNIKSEEFLKYACENSSLCVLSKYSHFPYTDWSEILCKICEEEKLHGKNNSQSECFTAFTILGHIFRLLLLEDRNTTVNIHYVLDDIKTKILDIKNPTLQITVLEDIFVIMFAKNTELDVQNREEYICKEKAIRLILHILKLLVDEMSIKIVYAKDSQEYSRFTNLSKYVADSIWRMELVSNVKSPIKCESNILKYMLAAPMSLIQMCLKKGDFKRAYQVIEIFSLEKSFISSEIKYTEKLLFLREHLKRFFKMKTMQKQNPNINMSNIELNMDKIISKFFQDNPTVVDEQREMLIQDLSTQHNFFKHYKAENEIFMNVLDLSITQTKCIEDCDIFLKELHKSHILGADITSNYGNFYKKLTEFYSNTGRGENLTLSEILLSPNYNLRLNNHKKEGEFYKRLAETYKDFNSSLGITVDGNLDSHHPSHKIILNLNTLCNDYVDWKLNIPDNVKYISKLYNYLKAFSKILYIEQDNSDIISKGKRTSFFDLLYYNRSELMGKLLFERHLDPSEFEKYFAKLKLDYLYHVVGNCFPTINLHAQENITKDELYPENSLYIPSKSIITYIQKRNWLLAFMLNEIYKVDGVHIDISEVRIRSFLNYMKLPKIQHLKVLFNNNEIVTALQNDINTQKVSEYINTHILQNECLVTSNYSTNSYESLETAEEIIEGTLKSTNWKELFDILEHIPESQLKKNTILIELRDMILVNIVQDGFEKDCFKFVQLITDKDVRIGTILCNLQYWPCQFCIDVIKSEISKCDTLKHSKMAELKKWLQQIQLCKELKKLLELPTWFAVFEVCENRPEEIIKKLLLCDKIRPLLDFINLHKPNEDLLLEVDQNYLTSLFDTSVLPDDIKKLLDHLPYNHSINICYGLLKLLKQIDNLQFIVDYLLNNVKDDLLRNVQISLKILSVLSQNEQEQLLCLIHEPLDIIETLIMNTKLDKLAAVLTILETELAATEFSEAMLSIEKVDEVLRHYAEKSLDFRVITQPNPRLLRTPECKLMQSIDSLNLCTDSRGFMMPDEVPLKDEWVQNNEVLDCMCCQKVTFSMFNRRHHCRRCGRVVCYSCSLHRMLVEKYGNILVRVCMDCYEQTLGDGQTSQMNDTISTKSMINEYWFLSDDPDHNKIVREEFSYEHAPSVSLCLSIMKYHSKSVEYPKFLLEQCNIMLKLLQPSQEPVQEIDYLLVIKMLKSLAIAAKMSSIECTLHYGTSLADRILSQADLLGLLAERGCLSLLPVSSTNQCSFIDAAILRKLRDRLLEREQWNLALEMSTKAGLDVTGVFAAWGKSCLKAGSLLAAREKFQRCLDKTGHYESLSDYNSQSDFDENSESLNKLKYSSKHSSINLATDTKPMKNPPLLNEIVYILESKTVNIDSDVLKQTENQKLSSSMMSLSQSSVISFQTDAAICIMNKLKNLTNIAAGNYYESPNKDKPKIYPGRPSIDAVFYDECVYYLMKYGTHLSLLEFYIKHSDIDRALNHIVDNQLSIDVFTDIYMRCLKDGIIGIFQEHMSKIDSTLDIWKNYLCCICRHLEKQQMLHSLYQLQQFMGDYIRAAMTCIRFYQENVHSFSDLASNVKFLYKAEEHLKHVLEQEQWVDVATVRRLSSTSKESFEAKGITNPSLVMKMNAKEIDKHIDTIWRQKELVDFLAECENSDIKPMQIFSNILPPEEPTAHAKETKQTVPTVFGSTQEKLYLAVLAIICGKNVEDGFDIALRIIQDFKLKPVKVYCEAGKQLAKVERYDGIGQLVSCIKGSGNNDDVVRDMCDEMLSLAVATLTKANVTSTRVEDLIKLISDRSARISAYIDAKQLKTAYFLAVKYKRMSDIRRILREAELLNQPNIKVLCQRILQTHSHSPNHPRNNNFIDKA